MTGTREVHRRGRAAPRPPCTSKARLGPDEVTRKQPGVTREMEVGTIEWHDRLGAYGFGSSRDMDLFRDASAMEEVARFLERVNVL